MAKIMFKEVEIAEIPEPPDPKPSHEITNRHWLETYVSKEDEDTWGQGYDYEVTHECEWINAGGYWYPSCNLQYEQDNMGVDIFDPEGSSWPDPPFKVEIRHHFSTYRTYEGDYDYDSWVEIVE